MWSDSAQCKILYGPVINDGWLDMLLWHRVSIINNPAHTIKYDEYP